MCEASAEVVELYEKWGKLEQARKARQALASTIAVNIRP